MKQILEDLKTRSLRESTQKTYFRIWRQFNKFVVCLDRIPSTWEERTSLFLAHLIDSGAQSASIKSYVSAIKRILDDCYEWNDTKVLLHSLTRACRLINDRVRTRLPIQSSLMELLLFEIQRYLHKQPYLITMYSAMIVLHYYGLLRIGELTESPHVIKAMNVNISRNKEKILTHLYSSKMHGAANRPQSIKISSRFEDDEQQKKSFNWHFCPFNILNTYINVRHNPESYEEQFFIF